MKSPDLIKNPGLLHPECLWKILDYPPKRRGKNHTTHFLCKCPCGIKEWKDSYSLRSGHSKSCLSCGLMRGAKKKQLDMRIRPDLLYQGCTWVVQSNDPKVNVSPSGGIQTLWFCKCSVHGQTGWVGGTHLRNGHSRGCPLCTATISKERNRKLPYEYLFSRILASKKYDDLTYEQFLEFTHILTCHYCGEPLHWEPHQSRRNRSGKNRYNLDRKDSDRGYTKSNLVVCCPRCNWAKLDLFTYEKFLEIGKLIRAMREGTPYAYTPTSSAPMSIAAGAPR